MKVRELTQGIEAVVTGPDVEVRSLAYDSRRVEPGALFAALVGVQADGHAHVPAAIAKGAVAVLCERPVDVGSATTIAVPNSRQSLAQIGRRFFADPAAAMQTVGVTGTNGKTTTVHLLESVLAAAGMRPGIIGTLGTRFAGNDAATGMTTPESVDLLRLLAAMRDAGVRAVAMEVSSHALAQERVAGVDFDVGIFTNLTHDHLDYHGDLERYFAAKARLFTERLKADGAAVLNLDDPKVASLAGGLPADQVLGFSLANNAAASVRVTNLRLSADGIDVDVRCRGVPLSIHSPLVGRFNAANVVGAVAAAVALKIPAAAIRDGVAALARVPGRLDRVPAAGGPVVLVDYAHTPDALAKALATVRELCRGRLICVFGCGGDRDPHKRPVMGETAARLADWTVVTSDNPRSEAPQAILAAIVAGCDRAGAATSDRVETRGYLVEADRAKAIERGGGAARPGDVVLIAGKGHETYQQVGTTKRPFDDRVHAARALAAAGYQPSPEPESNRQKR
ncbi:MAG: UDP-N-acetylmuramoyl-L-alanyl-D-glutamate--2,6-diaminopimelate ligase [Deltaproteobacteria bacterium]|nr:UDP-N-acetylmuramoyl-L-alanyl-D-glutamate--2,6-diaminopimelate ligase [Deltaproteobacteria bacterium]